MMLGVIHLKRKNASTSLAGNFLSASRFENAFLTSDLTSSSSSFKDIATCVIYNFLEASRAGEGSDIVHENLSLPFLCREGVTGWLAC